MWFSMFSYVEFYYEILSIWRQLQMAFLGWAAIRESGDG